MRIKRKTRQDAGVPLSPLIDCVFLLLIFFLVTSMIKRWEHQVPVRLPDQSATLADQPERQRLVIAVDARGQHYRQAGLGQFGEQRFEPITDLAAHLFAVASERGTGVPIEIAAERTTPFQVLLDTIDICQLQGFEEVSSRITTHLRARR
jgi:biopolymer transport protein ExbD